MDFHGQFRLDKNSACPENLFSPASRIPGSDLYPYVDSSKKTAGNSHFTLLSSGIMVNGKRWSRVCRRGFTRDRGFPRAFNDWRRFFRFKEFFRFVNFFMVFLITRKKDFGPFYNVLPSRRGLKLMQGRRLFLFGGGLRLETLFCII